MKTTEQNQKELVRFIIEKEKEAEDWNKKIYTYNDGTSAIFLNDEKIDVTEMVDACRDEKGYINVGDIVRIYVETIEPIIEAEFDYEMGDITEEEFKEKKQKIINSIK